MTAASNSDAESILRGLIHQQFNRAAKAETQRDEALAEVQRLNSVIEPCVCPQTYANFEGPLEDCPQHGRKYSDWIERAVTAHAAGYADGVAASENALENLGSIYRGDTHWHGAILDAIHAVHKLAVEDAS